MLNLEWDIPFREYYIDPGLQDRTLVNHGLKITLDSIQCNNPIR